ncbi:lasso RiPP family leader peptide-containing protein [Streptomyces sp. NPDC050560]
MESHVDTEKEVTTYEPPQVSEIGSFREVTLGQGLIVIDYNGYYFLD